MTSGSYDAGSLAGLALIALAIVSGVLMLGWWRGGLRHRSRARRVTALAALTLFLCFDLVVFGAFTRLTDSGLGCPDWPGCYATASPVAAARSIADAQALAPTGPVTERKAWIEMIHRYFAMALGALITLLLAFAWRARAQVGHAWKWALATLIWVVVQGLFGALTVRWKLYPVVVTGHLLGGMALLALLALQRAPPRVDVDRVDGAGRAVRGHHVALAIAALALLVQIALGGWVSTNYAVLACSGFPRCNGHWWPTMNWSEGFTFLRDLGRRADGEPIAMTALVAIQWAHRLFAVALVAAMGWLVARLWQSGPRARRRGGLIAGLVLLQLVTGLSNVVLDWPMVAALAHTAGAAALVVCLGLEAAAVVTTSRTRVLSA